MTRFDSSLNAGSGLGQRDRGSESTPRCTKSTPPSVSEAHRNIPSRRSDANPHPQKARISILKVAFMDFPKEEERILEFWREIDAFRTSVKLSEGKKPYTFYDGPPFCTG